MESKPSPKPETDPLFDSNKKMVKNRLLITTKSKNLILPYVRSKVNIEFVNTIVQDELRGFVIEQKLPYASTDLSIQQTRSMEKSLVSSSILVYFTNTNVSSRVYHSLRYQTRKTSKLLMEK